MPHHDTTESPEHPEATAKKGDFAEGREEHRGADDAHRGSFAEGQERHDAEGSARRAPMSAGGFRDRTPAPDGTEVRSR
jgi:hypothetical protein